MPDDWLGVELAASALRPLCPMCGPEASDRERVALFVPTELVVGGRLALPRVGQVLGFERPEHAGVGVFYVRVVECVLHEGADGWLLAMCARCAGEPEEAQVLSAELWPGSRRVLADP